MARDTNKAKKSTAVKPNADDNEAEKSQPSSDEQKSRRGWKDVFDNSTYSSGPGDNIYVFG